MLSTVDLCTRFSKMGTPLNSANGLTLTPGGGTAESEEVTKLCSVSVKKYNYMFC